MSKKYLFSETFYSMQGEGFMTGKPSIWLRYFGCSLQCKGFGQSDPTDPSTYVDPLKDINLDAIDKLEDLPALQHGCDSDYSVSKQFKRFQHQKTSDEIVEELLSKTPNGKFGKNIQLCLTGGEPLLKNAQQCTLEIIKNLRYRVDEPRMITFETNGTRALEDDLFKFLSEIYSGQILWSVSPKLFTVSGEPNSKAIKPEIVRRYYNVQGSTGQLKFVCNGTKENWEEIETIIQSYRDVGIDWGVWIMPVGCNLQGQKGQIHGHLYTDAEIADMALEREYNVSARVHVYLYNNLFSK